ncbi:MAG: GntR family transcriptional regulator [Desulfobacter sp.]|nr:GntR family transcriptional regulator [Desulfobacter sp.]WDP84435.1 MAG: GntR family transcriptional regulator [Desulfobacter sp.]
MKLKTEKASKQPLAVTAYEAIVQRIICLEYQPSQHLEETQLMADLGIGRTPVREALVRLQGEKMVESHPNRGVIVRPITLQNTKAMFESMRIFENGVAEIALTKNCSIALEKMKADNQAIQRAVQEEDLLGMVEANHQFHMDFAGSSQNEFLIRATHDVRSEAKRLSYLSYNTIIDSDQSLESHYASVIKEHDKIISCLETKNILPLRELLKHHIETFRNRIIQFMVS